MHYTMYEICSKEYLSNDKEWWSAKDFIPKSTCINRIQVCSQKIPLVEFVQ